MADAAAAGIVERVLAGCVTGADAFDRAFALDRPVVVEVHVDPEVPPLPPHLPWDEENKLMRALIHGDPNRWRVIKQAAKQMWATVSAP